MNNFFSGKSAASKGSLFQIRNRFKFKNVKKKISDCVNEVHDFLVFTTEALVCLLVCHLLDINTTEDEHEHETDKSELLRNISRQVIEIIKPNIDQTSINKAAQDLDATLPYENEENCQDVEDLDETVYYADDTRNVKDDSDNEDFEDERPPITVQDDDDHIFMYSCGLLWNSLKIMSDKGAERENDGDAMLSDWRINMVDFWENRHNKYLILGHRLLAAVAGWLPHQLREDLTWNSTANLSGGPGNNLALGLVNEFQNNEFKGNLKNAHGQYSDQQVERCSRLVGSLGKGIKDIFSVKIMSQYAIKAKTTRQQQVVL